MSLRVVYKNDDMIEAIELWHKLKKKWDAESEAKYQKLYMQQGNKGKGKAKKPAEPQ